jgi:hypothetical protein
METSGEEKFRALRRKLGLAVLQQQREALLLIDSTQAPFAWRGACESDQSLKSMCLS